MDIPFLCSGAALVFLEPGLHGIWAWLASVVIVAIILTAVAVFCMSPVAGAFSLREKEAPVTTSRRLITGSVLACLGLLVGLTSMVFPMGCATHAQLISAYIPPDVTDINWDVEAKTFAENVEKEAKKEKQMIRDLAPVR